MKKLLCRILEYILFPMVVAFLVTMFLLQKRAEPSSSIDLDFNPDYGLYIDRVEGADTNYGLYKEREE